MGKRVLSNSSPLPAALGGTGRGDLDIFAQIEQSVWTPAVSAATPGDLTAPGTLSGAYYKIGKRVRAEFVIAVTPAYTTAAGNFQITGLPFTSTTRTSLGGGQFSTLPAFTWPTNAVNIQPVVTANSKIIILQAMRTSAISSTVPVTSFTTGVAVTFRGYVDYMID